MESHDLYQSDDPCSQLEDLLPAYGMGLCDPDEALEVEGLLKQCPEMQSELEEYRQLAAHMPYTAESRSAPPQLLTRILNAAASDASGAPTHTLSASQPDDPAQYTNGTVHGTMHGTMQPSSAPTLKTSRLRDLPFERPELPDQARLTNNNPWRLRAVISTVAAAAAVILFIGANIFWSTQMRERETAIEETQNLLKTLGEDQLIRFDLGSVDQSSPDARGTVWCNPDNKVAVVRAENLPADAQRQDLKVWLWYGDQREEAGDVWINDQGRGTAVITASQPMANYEYVVIAQHTSVQEDQVRPFIRGDLYRYQSSYPTQTVP